MTSKSYGQFCGLARSLDVAGDRWSLLIVRELLISPARFGELRAGLPGIATNLLTARLKALEAQGVIERRLAADRKAIVYALTPWGEKLREPVAAFIRWSAPTLATGRRNDSFNPRWLVPALSALLADRQSEPAATLVLVVEGTPVQVTIDSVGPRVEVIDEVPAVTSAVLRTDPETALALAAKAITVEEAITSDGHYTGDPGTLRAVLG